MPKRQTKTQTKRRTLAERVTASRKTETVKRPTASRRAVKRLEKPPAAAKPTPAPAARAAAAASLARRKAELINELRENGTTATRQAEVRAELEKLEHVPVLSFHELQRLGRSR